MQTTLLIISFFALGYVARRRIKDTADTVHWVNTYIIYLAMPSIILVKIPNLEFNTEMLIPAAFAWAWGIVGGAIMLIVSRLLSFPRPLEGAAILLSILGNTSFLGYPMIQAFFSDDVLNYAIIYDQLGSFLILSTLGIIIIALYSPNSTGQTIGLGTITKKVFSFPPFVALIIAALLPIEPVIEHIEPILLILGKTLMPMALIVIGLQFQPQLLPEHRLPLGSSIVIKMMVAPSMAYCALVYTHANDSVIQATIFEAAMPCMITPGIMAIQAGLAPRFCATLLGYSTLFSFAWLPLVATLLQ